MNYAIILAAIMVASSSKAVALSAPHNDEQVMHQKLETLPLILPPGII